MENVNPFNNAVEKYDQWFERYHWVYQSELFAIERLLPRRANAVEIGVGSGRFASPFSIHTGLDSSENMLKLAKQRDIEVVLGTAEDMPFYDESFNLALMVTTLCFLDDVKKSLKESHRILKSGGQLVIGFIDRMSPLARKYKQEKAESSFYTHARFYSPEELCEILKEIAFDDFFFVQTLFQPIDEIKNVEPVKNGYGRGSFIVLRCVKL